MGLARSVACNLIANEILKKNGFLDLVVNEKPFIDDKEVISLTPTVVKENHLFTYVEEPIEKEEEFPDDSSLPVATKNNSCRIKWNSAGLRLVKHLL